MMNRQTRCTAALLLVGAALFGGLPAAAATATEPERPSLTAADRDFVVRVRLAGLWEMPAGDLAAAKGSTARVKEVGRLISDQHAKLDRITVIAARKLGITLPDEPNADQAHWLREMRAASGPEFDRIFAQRLREAHGRIFPAIATVRADTRNPVVRQLADDANQFVKTHLGLLDSTGAVDYDVLPDLRDPAGDEHRFVLLGDPRHPDQAGASQQVRQVVVALIGSLGALLALVLGARVLFPTQGTRVVRPPEPEVLPHRRR